MLISVSETEHNSVYTGREYAVENECAPAGELLTSAENYTRQNATSITAATTVYEAYEI